MKVIHLVRLPRIPIFRQLQIEEALIRTDQRNWCLINEGSTDTIVMGISGKPELLINPTTIPIIRRFSGGGTVLVDENTCLVTVICNHADVDAVPFPKQILEWNGKLYNALPGFSIRENDYTIKGKKFGGNAQYITKNRWLHHSTLLWDYSLKKMDALKMPPNMPEYRKGRSHKDFLTSLKDNFPAKETLFDGVISSLNSFFAIKEVSYDLLHQLPSVPHRKSTSLIDSAGSS